MVEATDKPLIIYDTSVILHKIVDLTQKDGKIKTKLTNKERDRRIKLGVDLYNTVYWGSNLPSDVDILWVGDNKTTNYWRVKSVRDYLNSLSPEDMAKLPPPISKGYKGNRFTEPYRTWCQKRINKFSNCLSFPGYEADDVAAAVVKVLDNSRPVYLATVDSDWLQMVTEKVTWVCMTGFNPPIRDIDNGIMWLRGKIAKETVNNKNKLLDEGITSQNLTIPDIIKYKCITGDASDNLPPNCPRYFIDLFNPPKPYKLWENEMFLDVWQEHIMEKEEDVIEADNIMDDWMESYGWTNLTPTYFL